MSAVQQVPPLQILNSRVCTTVTFAALSVLLTETRQVSTPTSGQYAVVIFADVALLHVRAIQVLVVLQLPL